jgi:DNA repair protein RecO (recombination protein O)
MQAKYSDGIILSRINYAESDRIITVLSKDFGKIKLIARGVRKENSRLAGGIELFTVSHFGFVTSRGELDVLVSSRLKNNYVAIVNDLNRVNFAYEALKKLNKITESRVEQSYFDLLKDLLNYLSQLNINLDIIISWWLVNLAKTTGHSINLQKPLDSKYFNESFLYSFVEERGGFIKSEIGFRAEHIKFLIICASSNLKTLQRIKNGDSLALELNPMLRGFVEYVH